MFCPGEEEQETDFVRCMDGSPAEFSVPDSVLNKPSSNTEGKRINNVVPKGYGMNGFCPGSDDDEQLLEEDKLMEDSNQVYIGNKGNRRQPEICFQYSSHTLFVMYG